MELTIMMMILRLILEIGQMLLVMILTGLGCLGLLVQLEQAQLVLKKELGIYTQKPHLLEQMAMKQTLNLQP